MIIARLLLCLGGVLEALFFARLFAPGIRIMPFIPLPYLGLALPLLVVLSYYTAKRQDRSGVGWAVFVFFLPFIAALMLALLPGRGSVSRRHAAKSPLQTHSPASAASAAVQSPKKSTPLSIFQALCKEQPEAALRLIEEGGDVNEEQPSGDTALHMASFKGYADVVRKLLEKSANINARMAGGGDPGATPLHLAAMKGHVDAIILLIENGADLNTRLGGDGNTSTSGASPLHLAAAHDTIEAARALVEKGADIEAEDDYGDTALHYAANRGFEGMVRVLVGLGADVNVVDDYGRTPLKLAGHRGEIVGILREAGARE
jgi:cytohesin